MVALIGWADAVEVVEMYSEPDRPSRIRAVNIETRAIRDLAEGQALTQSQAPGWVLCQCRRNAGEPTQLLVFSAVNPGRGVRLETDDPTPPISLFPGEHRKTYLDRVRIQPVPRPVPVDVAYRLSLQGWDAEGTPVAPQAVRWWSDDTTTALVDSSGTVHPRRIGAVTVHASAGGWRQDSVVLRVGPASVNTVIAEDWRGGIGAGWVSFGEPQPYVAKVQQGFALAPNGDSTGESGVYATRALRTADGLGIEFSASVPRDRIQWQSLRVSLAAVDPVQRRFGDQRSGDLPNAIVPLRGCQLQYPSAEGIVRATGLSFSAGGDHLLRAPPAMHAGAWVRFRLQLLSDGRCAVAVNGKAEAISDQRVPIGDSATILIIGIAHHTRVLIGHLEAWTGVRRDIDWSALDRDRQPKH